MKKIKEILLVSAITLFGFANAQQFGLKAGMNVSSVSNVPNKKSLFGFNGGIFMNAPISENFSIQPELLYSSKGTKIPTGSLKYDYISLPVMFQYNATEKFYLEFGPEFDFLVSARNKPTTGTEVDIVSTIKGFDFDFGIGLGYDFTENFGGNMRYLAGFTNTLKSTSGSSQRNSTFQLGLYYKFGSK